VEKFEKPGANHSSLVHSIGASDEQALQRNRVCIAV
jgi:hypothetical protein